MPWEALETCTPDNIRTELDWLKDRAFIKGKVRTDDNPTRRRRAKSCRGGGCAVGLTGWSLSTGEIKFNKAPYMKGDQPVKITEGLKAYQERRTSLARPFAPK